MTSKQKFIIITSAVLAIEIAEAFIFYNLGRNANQEGFKVQFPKGTELLRILGMVAVTSLLTAYASNTIEKIVEGNTLKSIKI